MAVTFKNDAEAQAYADKLVLDSAGLPPLTEDVETISQLLKHSTTIGRDIFSIDRFTQWVAARTQSLTQAAAGSNLFNSAPCPITEQEFAKYAPNVIHCIFVNEDELKRIPQGLGQRLRCDKKHGDPRENPRTGTKSGGSYKSGAFGYWLGGPILQSVNVPGKGTQMVRYRPTINMAAENSGAGQKTRNRDAQQGQVDGEDEELLEE